MSYIGGCMCMYVYVGTYVCMCLCMYVCMYVYVCVCVCAEERIQVHSWSDRMLYRPGEKVICVCLYVCVCV